jgi:hypothetical protein
MTHNVKALALTVAMLLGWSGLSQAQQEYEILFTCDMSVQILVGNFDPNNGTDQAFVRGSFNGWSEDNPLSPNFLDPNKYETVVNDSLTPVADTVAYKFFYRSTASGDVWEGGSDRKFSATGNETDTNGNGIPELIVPERFFDDIGPDDIFTSPTDVVFEVDVRPAKAFLADSGAITFGGGNVTSIDTVYLAGGAPKTTPALAWVWDLPPGNPQREALQMNDTGINGDEVAGDDVWSITINFDAGAPKVIDWKHGISGFDNEAGFAENHNGNVATANGRVHKVFGENGLGAGKSNWYASYIPVFQDSTEYEMLFTCDMSVQILVGNFDPNNGTDQVFVRGSFNGWSEDNPLSPNFLDPNKYETVVNHTLRPVSDTLAYKFFYRSAASGDVWEGGSDRKFSATGNETDANQNNLPELVIPERYFDDIGPDDIFTAPKDVVFEVDMSPALAFLADSGAITFGGGNVTSVDTVYLAGGAPKTTPALAWVWDLPPGNPQREALQMNDNGTNGDATAGDNVWSITINFDAGAPKVIDWKHGISGFDNEAGFAENHNGNVDTPSGRVFRIFGQNGVGAGKSNWYAPYITVGIGDLDEEFFSQPSAYQLFQNYPNPFNPSTTIEFALSKAANVRLEIFNIVGQKVRTLVSERVAPGGYQVVWDGLDDNGRQVTTGVYLYRFTADNFVQTRKMLFVK